jgi:integrase
MPHFPKPFYRKSRGLWYVQIDGKQHNLGPDRDQAFETYHDLMRQPETVAVVGESVLAIIDAFLDWCHKNRARDTYEWYRWRLEMFARSIPRNLTVGRLKPIHVQTWIDSYDTWSSGSKRNGCRAVQRALNWAEKQGIIDKSPIAHMEKPAAGKRETVLSEREFTRLLALAPGAAFRDLLTATWETGCRPQESLIVEARHVDLQNCRWVIPESEAKTDAIRIVYLTEAALEITRTRMLRFPVGPIFRNSRGKPWTTNAVNNGFQRIQIRMGKQIMRDRTITVSDEEIAEFVETLKPNCCVQGVTRPKRPAELRCEAKQKLTVRKACELAPKYCLYTLRHTWMNRLLQNGVDGLTVAVLAGHSDPSVLAKTYQHLSQSPAFLLMQARKVAG